MRKNKKLDKLIILVMVWTLTNQILIMANDASSESEEATSEELPEDCTYLNKSSGKPKTQNATNIDILEILNDGSKYLVDEIDRFIGIFGLTGVGKTVMSYILAGDLNKIHGVLTEGGNLVIVDEDNKIGAPSTVSRTLVPNIFYKIEEDGNRTAFMDSPGYGDNRGYETDIAANFFINQMMRKAKEVKFLFLTVHSSVIPGHDRTSFPNLVSYASRFIKNIEKYENSIGLVVTKVKSYNDRGMFQKDKKLLNEVVGFIKDFNKTLNEKLEQSNSTQNTDILQNQVKFVEILLHQDKKGRYDRIVFSRSPESCGPLSQSEFVLQTRKNLGKLYNGLNYAAADSSDFGYTLKPSSLLELKVEKEAEINELIANATTELISNFWGFHYNSQLNAKVDNPRDIYARISKRVERSSSTDSSLSALNQSSTPDEILNAVKANLFDGEGYQTPENIRIVLNTQSKLLTFFDEANNGKMKRELATWIAPLFSMKQGFKDYKSWYEFCINLEDKMKLYSRLEIPTGRSLPTSTYGWLNLLEELNYGPAINAKFLSRRVNQNALEVFDKIMQWAFQPVRKECKVYSYKVKISGNFIKLSDYFDKVGKIKSICYGKTHIIQIHAAHTIFFDNDVNLEGEEFSVLIFAYNWVAVNFVNINLDGSSGSPAKTLVDLDSLIGHGKGWDGLAGNPGGPGGAFSGLILGNGENLHMISIRAVGGKGGNGENGGDGGAGRDGGRPDVGYSKDYACGYSGNFWNSFRYYCGAAKPGESGGDGGNGGEGGLGGYSGRVSVVSLKFTTAAISIRTGKGESGSSGRGGSGGPGGWYGKSVLCTKTEYGGVQFHRDCEYKETNMRA